MLIRRIAGVYALFAAGMMILPARAPAGCMAGLASYRSCTGTDATISGCAAIIGIEDNNIAQWQMALRSEGRQTRQLRTDIAESRAEVLRQLRFWASAKDYAPALEIRRDCSDRAFGIEICESGLRVAQDGQRLLERPYIARELSGSTRARLRDAFRAQAGHFIARLQVLSVGPARDPSVFCNAVFASYPACVRAVAADSAAVNSQIYPVYQCGRTESGSFVTAADEAEQDREIAAEPWMATTMFTFRTARTFYAARLASEQAILSRFDAASQAWRP